MQAQQHLLLRWNPAKFDVAGALADPDYLQAVPQEVTQASARPRAGDRVVVLTSALRNRPGSQQFVAAGEVITDIISTGAGRMSWLASRPYNLDGLPGDPPSLVLLRLRPLAVAGGQLEDLKKHLIKNQRSITNMTAGQYNQIIAAAAGGGGGGAGGGGAQ